MNSRVVVIAGVLGLLSAGVGFYLYSSRPESERPEDVAAPVTRAPEAASPAPARPAPTAAPSPARPRPGAEAADAAPSPAPVEAAPDTATLTIGSDVAGAQVFLDRNYLGVTPLTVPNVRPGTHQLNVTAAGYDGIAETIDVAPGPRDINVEFKAVRLSARISVVHKHGLGSCEGTLSATPDGLRYDTANKGDAFAVPLTGLDTFAVDYTDKNLKLKLKNRKTYNFTDREGNADRLFVFHRDVENVRVRLSKGQ